MGRNRKQVTTTIDPKLHKEALINDIIWADALELGVKQLLGRNRSLEEVDKKIQKHEDLVAYYKGERNVFLKEKSEKEERQQKLKEESLKEAQHIETLLEDCIHNAYFTESVFDRQLELLKKAGWSGTRNDFRKLVDGYKPPAKWEVHFKRKSLPFLKRALKRDNKRHLKQDWAMSFKVLKELGFKGSLKDLKKLVEKDEIGGKNV